MITSEALTDLLKMLESGIPLDHPARQDARIAQLEEAIKMLIGHVLDGVVTQGPGPSVGGMKGPGPSVGGMKGPGPDPDPTMAPNPTWLQT